MAKKPMMKDKKANMNDDTESSNGLTAAQKKLPKPLQDAILKKMKASKNGKNSKK
jgi:hypothetical protein